jgi:hypothetical protein
VPRPRPSTRLTIALVARILPDVALPSLLIGIGGHLVRLVVLRFVGRAGALPALIVPRRRGRFVCHAPGLLVRERTALARFGSRSHSPARAHAERKLAQARCVPRIGARCQLLFVREPRQRGRRAALSGLALRFPDRKGREKTGQFRRWARKNPISNFSVMSSEVTSSEAKLRREPCRPSHPPPLSL